MDFIERHKKTLYDRMETWDKWQKRKAALMGLERQFKSYCRLSEHHSWNRQTEYIKLFDLFWNAVLEGKLLEESAWEYHESIKPENIAAHKDADKSEASGVDYTFCNIFACNVEEFLNTLLDDTEDEEAYLLLFLDYIVCWLNEAEQNAGYEIERHLSNQLIQTELTRQSEDMAEVFRIHTFEEAAKWRMDAKDVLWCQD